jgi:hypothetical protein
LRYSPPLEPPIIPSFLEQLADGEDPRPKPRRLKLSAADIV